VLAFSIRSALARLSHRRVDAMGLRRTGMSRLNVCDG
jgi:hypothetical protein